MVGARSKEFPSPSHDVHGCVTLGVIHSVVGREMVAGRESTPPTSTQKERSLSSPPKKGRYNSRVQHQNPHLFWVRRELVLNKSFQASDCYLAGRETLLIPTTISYSKDLWRREAGSATFAEVVKMVGGGRGAGKVGQGRGAKPPTPVPPPSSSTRSGAAQLQQQSPIVQEAPIQLGAAGNFNINMMQQMGAASQGTFPMMNPAMWNIPIGLWPQFSQMNSMMPQQGQFGVGVVHALGSQSSSIGVKGASQ
jgi:hypothetical protein